MRQTLELSVHRQVIAGYYFKPIILHCGRANPHRCRIIADEYRGTISGTPTLDRIKCLRSAFRTEYLYVTWYKGITLSDNKTRPQRVYPHLRLRVHPGMIGALYACNAPIDISLSAADVIMTYCHIGIAV